MVVKLIKCQLIQTLIILITFLPLHLLKLEQVAFIVIGAMGVISSLVLPKLILPKTGSDGSIFMILLLTPLAVVFVSLHLIYQLTILLALIAILMILVAVGIGDSMVRDESGKIKLAVLGHSFLLGCVIYVVIII